MSVDFSNTPTDSILNKPSDTPMFGPTPVWERGAKKRRGAARTTYVAPTESAAESVERTARQRPAPERTIYVPPEQATVAEPVMTSVMPGETVVIDEPAETAYAPRTATTRRDAKSGVAPVALAAGVIVLAGLGAAGWYATQPHDQGVAQLTPGAASTTMTTTAPAMETAALTPATPAPPAAVERTATPTGAAAPARSTRVARARPAAAPSATEASSNVSATESAPMDTTNYGMTASDRAAAVNPAPAAPAMVTPAPAAPDAAAPAAVATPAPVTAPVTTTTP